LDIFIPHEKSGERGEQSRAAKLGEQGYVAGLNIVNRRECVCTDHRKTSRL